MAKRRSSSRSSRRSHSLRHNGARKCMRPGPITNNGYLNFLRVYRKNCCGMSPQETIRRGAKKWMSLSEREKDKYNRTARKSKRKMC